MQFGPQRLSLSLPKKAVFTLPDAHGVDIECSSGTLWITVDHDPRDIVLEAGERFRGDTHRRAIVAARSNARHCRFGRVPTRRRPHP